MGNTWSQISTFINDSHILIIFITFVISIIAIIITFCSCCISCFNAGNKNNNRKVHPMRVNCTVPSGPQYQPPTHPATYPLNPFTGYIMLPYDPNAMHIQSVGNLNNDYEYSNHYDPRRINYNNQND